MKKIGRDEFLKRLHEHFDERVEDAYRNLARIVSAPNGDPVVSSDQLRFESEPDDGQLDLSKLKY
jgi:hypothetical protein